MTEVDPELEYREALAAFHAAERRLRRARGRLIASRVTHDGQNPHAV
jgi:hypothetical protein